MSLLPLLEEMNSFTQTALDITQYCASKSKSKKQHSFIELKQQEHVWAAMPLFKQLSKHCHSFN